MRKVKQVGFTLIELMIVVVIVGVLAAIAYPAYSSHVIKGVRRAAQAQMLDLANREQQFLLANRSYATYDAVVTSGYSLPSDLTGKYTPTITVGVSTVPSFTITFTAAGTQSSDGNLTLNSEGAKAPSDKW